MQLVTFSKSRLDVLFLLEVSINYRDNLYPFIMCATNFKTYFRLNRESFHLEKDYDGLALYLTATV